MARAIILLVVSLELGACSSRAGYIRGPDGDDWLAVRCSRRKHVNCLQRAGKLCPDGYTVSDAAPVAGTMLIKCNGGSPKDRARNSGEPSEPTRASARVVFRFRAPYPAASPVHFANDEVTCTAAEGAQLAKQGFGEVVGVAAEASPPAATPPPPLPPTAAPPPPPPPPVAEQLSPEEQEAQRKREAEFEAWKKTQPAGTVAE